MRPTEDALFQSVSYYLENYEGRGVPETIIREMHETLLPRFYDAGQYRSVQVCIKGAIIVPPEPHQIGYLMREALDELQNALASADSSHEKQTAIVVFFHRFNAIHPFRDGNGRVSRAVLHLLLRQQGIHTAKNDFYDFFALRRDVYLETMKEGDRDNLYPLRSFVRIALLDAVFKDIFEPPLAAQVREMLDAEWHSWHEPSVRAQTPVGEYLGRALEYIAELEKLQERLKAAEQT